MRSNHGPAACMFTPIGKLRSRNCRRDGGRLDEIGPALAGGASGGDAPGHGLVSAAEPARAPARTCRFSCSKARTGCITAFRRVGQMRASRSPSITTATRRSTLTITAASVSPSGRGVDPRRARRPHPGGKRAADRGEDMPLHRDAGRRLPHRPAAGRARD